MTQTWLIGASINLVGSVMINLGTNIMKLGHNKRAAMEMRNETKMPIRVFREWQIGVIFFILGNLANFTSFGFAAQSLLAALGSIQFVSNVAFASLVLKEKVTLSVLLATGCIVCGCIMLVVFGSHSSTQFTVQEIMHLYTNPVYIVYLSCLGSFVIFLYFIYKYGKKKMQNVGFSGLCHYWYRLLPVSYALFSGMIGTQSVLFGKTISTLLRVTVGGSSQLGSWFTWVIVICFLSTSSFWITRLNKALKFFPAMMIVPTMQISWTFFSIVSGMLYFQEYKDLSILQGIFFSTAVTIIFFGVYLLTKMRAHEQHSSSRRTHNQSEDKHNEGTEHSVELQEQTLGDSLRISVQQTSWEGNTNLEDDKTPMVTTPASDCRISSIQKNHNDQHELAISRTMSLTSPDCKITEVGQEQDTVANNQKCGPCAEATIFSTLMEDLSLEFYSSLKGTVGLGPKAAPGITIFGPPGVWLADALSVSTSHSCPSTMS